MGRGDEAAASYERQMAIAEALVKTNPAAPGAGGFSPVPWRSVARCSAAPVALPRQWTRCIDRWRCWQACPIRYQFRSTIWPVRNRYSRAWPRCRLPRCRPPGPAAADAAMSTLRRAVAAGYRDLALMNHDSDLDPLRSSAEFQVLMMDLAFPDQPFAHSAGPAQP